MFIFVLLLYLLILLLYLLVDCLAFFGALVVSCDRCKESFGNNIIFIVRMSSEEWIIVRKKKNRGTKSSTTASSSPVPRSPITLTRSARTGQLNSTQFLS